METRPSGAKGLDDDELQAKLDAMDHLPEDDEADLAKRAAAGLTSIEAQTGPSGATFAMARSLAKAQSRKTIPAAGTGERPREVGRAVRSVVDLCLPCAMCMQCSTWCGLVPHNCQLPHGMQPHMLAIIIAA